MDVAPRGRPNVLLIVCDDLGWGDLGCYGNANIRTPNVDRLAKEGVRFTQFYAAGVQCTPSRAGLLTGRYPARFGVTYAYMEGAGGIPKTEELLPAALRPLGYRTGLVGKWHLGDRPEDHPLKHGFDRFAGLLRGHDVGPRDVWDGERVAEKDAAADGLTDRWTREAERFIADESRRGPWFLMVAHTAPHVPLAPGARFRGHSKAGAYGDTAEELDDSVGRLTAALARAGVAERTAVFVTSDNGPAIDQREQGGSTGGLRGGKYSVFEGGVRVPMIARGPGWRPRVEAGPAISLDLMPTCVSLAGGAPARADGRDLSALLGGTGKRDGAEFYFFFRDEVRGVRLDDWKWVRGADGGADLLFDLKADEREQRDVSRANAGTADALRRRAADFQRAAAR